MVLGIEKKKYWIYEKIRFDDRWCKRNIIVEFDFFESIYDGFKKFDLEKLENLISYFVDKVENLYLSFLNKYLWYIDFLYFKCYLWFIIGLSYICYIYGLVIKGFVYNEIVIYLSDKFFGEEYEIEDGVIKISFKSRRNYDLLLFI